MIFINFSVNVQEVNPKAQTDWITFLKVGAQCPQSGCLHMYFAMEIQDVTPKGRRPIGFFM